MPNDGTSGARHVSYRVLQSEDFWRASIESEEGKLDENNKTHQNDQVDVRL